MLLILEDDRGEITDWCGFFVESCNRQTAFYERRYNNAII